MSDGAETVGCFQSQTVTRIGARKRNDAGDNIIMGTTIDILSS